jgi:hypothetical protein
MGFLDDAIRQHLDLKRRLGADDDELKRLEDEAFGPPSRPGDPDFPESDAAGESSASEPVVAEGVAVEERPAESPTSETAGESPATDAEGSEPGSQADAGAPFYDQSDEELDLELDLEFEDEPEVTPAPPSAGEPPIESLDTVEHPFEGAAEETGESAEAEEEPDRQQATEEGADETEEEEVLEGELADEGGAGEQHDDEDVLEETPEFLRDAPEDDELWFEQGKPKDFDF